IDDVLDDDDVAAFDAAVQILHEPDFARRIGALAVARHGDEVDRDPGRHRADEIRHEDESALEDADKVDFLGRGIIAFDLPGKLANAPLNRTRVEQHFHPIGSYFPTAARTRDANVRASASTSASLSVCILRSRISTRPLTIVVFTSSPLVV